MMFLLVPNNVTHRSLEQGIAVTEYVVVLMSLVLGSSFLLFVAHGNAYELLSRYFNMQIMSLIRWIALPF